MITKFNLFESVNEREPQEGDYVLCQIDRFSLSVPGQLPLINDSMKTWMGYITRISDSDEKWIGQNNKYCIKFKKTEPDDSELSRRQKYFLSCFRFVDDNSKMKGFYLQTICLKREEIKFWSKNKEDIQMIIDANKYNL